LREFSGENAFDTVRADPRDITEIYEAQWGLAMEASDIMNLPREGLQRLIAFRKVCLSLDNIRVEMSRPFFQVAHDVPVQSPGQKIQ